MNCTITSASNFSGLQAGTSPTSPAQLAVTVRKSTLDRPFILPILADLVKLVSLIVELQFPVMLSAHNMTGPMKTLVSTGHLFLLNLTDSPGSSGGSKIGPLAIALVAPGSAKRAKPWGQRRRRI